MTIEYAINLFELGKYKDAQDRLSKVLSQDPENFIAHIYLSYCLLHLKKHTEAHREADLAIQLNPNMSLGFFAKALILIDEERYIKAEEILLHSLEYDPEDIHILMNLANCRIGRNDAHGAYEYTFRAMNIEPDNQDLVNQHIMLLNRLGKKEEAKVLLKGALHNAPEDSSAHANQGWAYLHNNDTKKSQIHFKEALRLDPDNEYARKGLLETLKAKNIIYRYFLNIIFWLSKFPTTTKLMLIIGGIIVYSFAERLSYAQPTLALYVLPLTFLYYGFIVLTWLSDPLFNFILFFHPLGRFVLNEKEKKASLYCSFFFIPAFIFGILYLTGAHAINHFLCYYLLLLIPVIYTIFKPDTKRFKLFLTILGLVVIYTFIIYLFLLYNDQIICFKFRKYGFYGWLVFLIVSTLDSEDPR